MKRGCQLEKRTLLETVTYIAIKERLVCIITIETVMCIMHFRKYHLHNCNRNSHLHKYNKNGQPHLLLQKLSKKKKKTLWPLFMDGVQLPQG